jgi:putative membrane protein
MKTHPRIAMLAMAGLLSLAPAFAQNQGTTQGTGGSAKANLSQQDRKFIDEAAKGGMMEVELGQLAVQKAASAEVRQFGQRMVQDHSQANQKLMQVASQVGVTVPKTLSADMRKEKDKLSGLSGAEFDRMYMSHMLKDHQKDVKEFEKTSQKGNNTAVRGFAQQTLPTLRQHLDMAQDVAAAVGVPGTKSGETGHKHNGH